jgi:O-antigen ligase
MERLIILLLFGLIFFSPLFYGSITVLPLFIVEASSFLLIFLFLLILFLSKDKISFIQFPAGAFFLFIALIIIQILPLPKAFLSIFSPQTLVLYNNFRVNNSLSFFTLSIYPEATINFLIRILSCLCVFFVVLNYIDSKEKIRRLLFTLILVGFLVSFYGLMQRVSIPESKFITSTFTYHNFFAAYLEMIIPLAIVFCFNRLSVTVRSILIFMTTVMILGLFFSLSRAGIICFCLGILLMLSLFKIKGRLKKGISISLLLFLALFIFLAAIGFDYVKMRMITLIAPLKALGGRVDIIRDSLKIVKDFPLFGTGLGTFGEIFQKYKTFEHGAKFIVALSEPLQLLVETGIVGFLLISLFFLGYFKRIFHLWKKRNDSFVAFIVIGCIVGLFSVILHSFFDFVLHSPANALLFSVIIALAYRVVYIQEPQRDLSMPLREISLSRPLKLFLIVVLCLLFIGVESFIFRRYQAEALFEKLENKKISQTGIDAVIEYRKALREIDKSINFNPLNNLYYAKKADLLSELATREDTSKELVNFAEFKDANAILKQAAKIYKKAINLNPTIADNHLKLGWLYDIINVKDLAKKEFEKALLLDPQNYKIKEYLDKFYNKTQ